MDELTTETALTLGGAGATVTLIVAVLKTTFPALPPRFAPLLAIVVGILWALGLFFADRIEDNVIAVAMTGITIGLTGSGVQSALRAQEEVSRVMNNVPGTTRPPSTGP
jgi:predicted RND superfamily exporter protein